MMAKPVGRDGATLVVGIDGVRLGRKSAGCRVLAFFGIGTCRRQRRLDWLLCAFSAASVPHPPFLHIRAFGGFFDGGGHSLVLRLDG